MQVITDTSKENLLRIIKADYPDLHIEKSDIHVHGMDNVVLEVNNSVIFRFPRDEKNSFGVELAVLQFLQSKLRFKIPNPKYIGKKYMYMGYEKIIGKIPTSEEMQKISTEQVLLLGNDIAEFFYELHKVLPIEKAKELGVETATKSSFIDLIPWGIGDFADADLLKFAEYAFQKYKKMVGEAYPEACIHSDVHKENMLLDENFRLKGVIDFGDVEIGDIHSEFKQLYVINPALLEATKIAYEKISGITLSLERIKVYAWINELADLVEFKNRPELRGYQKSIQRLQKWMAEEKFSPPDRILTNV